MKYIILFRKFLNKYNIKYEISFKDKGIYINYNEFNYFGLEFGFNHKKQFKLFAFTWMQTYNKHNYSLEFQYYYFLFRKFCRQNNLIIDNY